MSSSVRELLDKMPNAFLAAKAGNAKALIQLDLIGEDGGAWLLDIADGKCAVREERAPKPDVTVHMSTDDFVALYSNKLNPMQAFMTGRIKVTGNVGMVMPLMNWFDR